MINSFILFSWFIAAQCIRRNILIRIEFISCATNIESKYISCSMCYVNNSIYADVVPEIGECQRQLMMGAEFCYDAIANPKNYDMLRISNKSYTYTSDNQYALL